MNFVTQGMMTGQWWMLPVIAAGYAAAMAGINKLTSFDVGAKVQRGGAFSGFLHAGDRIINLDDFRSLVLAGGGARGGANVTVHVHMNGVQLGTPEVEGEFRRLGEVIRRAMDRP